MNYTELYRNQYAPASGWWDKRWEEAPSHFEYFRMRALTHLNPYTFLLEVAEECHALGI